MAELALQKMQVAASQRQRTDSSIMRARNNRVQVPLQKKWPGAEEINGGLFPQRPATKVQAHC